MAKIVEFQPTPRTGQRSNGFKKRDIRTLIGQQFGRLTVAGPSAKPGRVLCKCECGKNAEPKIADVQTGRTASCGCLKEENFKAFWNRKADTLPASIRRAVFNRLWFGLGKAVSSFGIDASLILACGRVHGAYLLETFSKHFENEQYLDKGHRRSHPDVCDLSHAEYRFLVRHTKPSGEPIVIELEDSEDLSWATDAGLLLAA
jgi:hypothetical protein